MWGIADDNNITRPEDLSDRGSDIRIHFVRYLVAR